MKKHRKKKVAGLTLTAVIGTMLAFWGDIYPVVCSRVNDPELCVALSMGALKQGGLDTGFKLDNGNTQNPNAMEHADAGQ